METGEEEVDAIAVLQDQLSRTRQAHRDLLDAIVWARDEAGMTFREIGAALDMAHGWVYRLYQRQKRRKK